MTSKKTQAVTPQKDTSYNPQKDTSRRAERDCFLALKGTIVPWLRHKCFDQRSIAAVVLH